MLILLLAYRSRNAQCELSGNAQITFQCKLAEGGLKVVSPYPEFRSKTLVYRGSDCVEKFMDGLNEIYDHCYEKLNTVSEIEFTENDHHEFETASTCSICTKEFEEGGELDKKVPDHDHISGKYRGAAHSSCNLKMWQQKEIIVYMHNAKG